MERKVIQIASISPSGNGCPAFLALCNDGTMWILDDNRYQNDLGWLQLKGVPPLDIPETKTDRFEKILKAIEPVATGVATKAIVL